MIYAIPMKTILVLSYIILSYYTFSQSKKEQIEILTNRVDSLNLVLGSERSYNINKINELNTTIKSLKSQINELTINVSKLSKDLQESKAENQKNKEEFDLQKKEISTLNVKLNAKTDSLEFIYSELKKIEIQNSKKSSKTSLFVNPEIDSITPEQIKELSKYFKFFTVNEFVSAMSLLRGSKTDKEFEFAFLSFQAIFSKMEDELLTKDDDPVFWINELTIFNNIFAIVPSCVAECTEFKFFWNIKKLENAALKTLGDFDDKYFKLKYDSECDINNQIARFSVGWLNIFQRTWDYGGHVTVGDNLAYELLKYSWEYQKESDLFKPFIEEMRGKIIRNLEHTIYYYSNQEVLSELNKIYNSTYISITEKAVIKKLIDRNRSSNTKLSPKLQFDCETKQCDYGG
jgi:outer membrane murein-binding lipoprotein Lpp